MEQQVKAVTMETSRTADKVVEILKRNETMFRSKYGISRIGVFGSIVRGEGSTDSDIDLLVDFEKNAEVSLLRFVEIERHLSELLGRKVDLVERRALKPFIGRQILSEVVYP